jgi:hypothetical protein
MTVIMVQSHDKEIRNAVGVAFLVESSSGISKDNGVSALVRGNTASSSQVIISRSTHLLNPVDRTIVSNQLGDPNIISTLRLKDILTLDHGCIHALISFQDKR